MTSCPSLGRTRRAIVSSLPLARSLNDDTTSSVVHSFQDEFVSLLPSVDDDTVFAAISFVFVLANAAAHLFLDGPSVLLTNL